MSTAEAGDAWRRGMSIWHVAFGVLAIVTGVLAAGDEGVTPVRRYLAMAVICLLCAWYAAFGVRALRCASPQLGSTELGLWYLAGAVPLTIGLSALSPVGGLMLVLLYPHMWSILPLRQAITGTAVVVVAVSCVILFT